MNADGFGVAAPRDLLAGLTSGERERVLEVGHERPVPLGTNLYNQGDHPGWTYILQQGMVRTFRSSRDGRQFTVGFWRENDIIGGPDIFSHAPRLLSAETTADSVLIGFTADELGQLIAELPRFARNMIAALSFKARWMMSTGDALSTASVAQRVAHVLLLHAEVHGERTSEGAREVTHMSHRDIATLVGASRQWVSQALSELQRRGLVRTGHRRITLIDEFALRQLVQL